MARLFSYVMTHDSGFAPHVGKGTLTLATCKPEIRRLATKDDYVMGIAGKGLSMLSKMDLMKRMVYLAKVTDKKDFDSYFADVRFTRRKDNIYHRIGGRWVQEKNDFHGDAQFEADLSSNNVLISGRFLYFGKNAMKLDDELFNAFARLSRKHRTTELDMTTKGLLESIFTRHRDRLNQDFEPCAREDRAHVECRAQ